MKISNDEYLNNIEREGIVLSPLSKRMSAFIIDDLLLGIIVVIIFWNIIVTYSDVEMMISKINDNIIYILIMKFLYHALFTWYYGQSIGKMIVKIRVIDLDVLDNPSFIDACIRSVARLLFEFFFYIGFLFFFISPLKQTLHDRVSKVVVVNDI